MLPPSVVVLATRFVPFLDSPPTPAGVGPSISDSRVVPAGRLRLPAADVDPGVPGPTLSCLVTTWERLDGLLAVGFDDAWNGAGARPVTLQEVVGRERS